MAMGMTLVTAAAKGQDISVGAGAAIAGSVLINVLRSNPFTLPYFLLALFASILAAMAVGAFNGTLVSVFRIQPMIATLIFFTIGRSIAFWINGGATPTISHPLLRSLGGFIHGVPIPTSIFVVILMGVIFGVVLKFTNLGLYIQSVGINQNSARLNGISPIKMKLLVFMILGVCVAVAAILSVGGIGLMNHSTILIGSEMDVILAVAIGGNALSGGKFNMIGSVIGAYVIQGLTITLYAMRVSSTDILAYKAVVVVILVVLGSPVVKEKLGQLWKLIAKKADDPKAAAVNEEGLKDEE
jgi:simple sugar transport system permease protein